MGATHSSSWAEQDPGLAIIESSGQFLTCCHRHEDTRRRQNTIVARSKWVAEKEMLNGKQATQTQRVPSASKSTSMASLPRSKSQDYALESVDLGVGTPIERTSRASKSKSETVQTSVGTPIQRVPSASKWKSMAFLPRSKSEDALESFETDGGTPIERVPSASFFQRVLSAPGSLPRSKSQDAWESDDMGGGTPIQRVPSAPIQRIPSATRRDHAEWETEAASCERPPTWEERFAKFRDRNPSRRRDSQDTDGMFRVVARFRNIDKATYAGSKGW